MLPSSIASDASHESGALARYRTGQGAKSYAGKYERSRARRWTAHRESAILEAMLLRFPPDASLLNIPCGAGRFVETIAPGARRRVVFADGSQAMLDAAKAFVSAAGPETIEFRLEDVTQPGPAGKFDVVLCVRLLHHFGDGAAFEAALDHLAGSASLGIICTFASSSTWKGWWRLLRRRFGGKRSGETLRSRSSVESAFEGRGWRVASSRTVSALFSTQTWLLLVPLRR